MDCPDVVETLDAWMDSGQRIPFGEHQIWCMARGKGATTTYWHGFPTSSYDWAHTDPLVGGRRVYMDHLGYGSSDKPSRFDHSFDARLAAARTVWDHFGVRRTHLVAHDMGVSMVQEALARLLDGTYQGPEIASVTFLNGGIYADVYQPLAIQKLLLNRIAGPIVSRLVRRRTFDARMREIFSDGHPPGEADMDAMWQHINLRRGRRLYHKLSLYQIERKQKLARWQDALARTAVPLRFLWGAQDPISGPRMVRAIRDRVPDADVVVWQDVGHFPQIEVPERVARELP